jgi:hypothetical protein
VRFGVVGHVIAVDENRGLQIQYISFKPEAWLATTISVWVLGSFTANPSLTVASLMCLPVFACLLWRVGEPPVLFFAVGFQWLQASTKIFDANIRGVPLQDYFLGWRIDEAIWLCLIGLVVLSVGVRTALTGFHPDSKKTLSNEVQELSIDKIWYLYLAFTVFVFFVQNYMWAYPRIFQLLHATLGFKWVLFFLLSMTVIGQRRRLYLLVFAFLLELMNGFSSFFSDFKQVFFILILAHLTFASIYTRRAVIVSTIASVTVVFLLIVWAAVKDEYRDYVNQGTGHQAVYVSYEDQLRKIVDLYTEIDATLLLQGFEELAKRVAYVDYFARVIEVVPDEMPHEQGKLWGNAVTHVLMPRLLFPDKADLELDTLLTEKYTGYQLILQGGWYTNVPLGYMAESYIDFGPVVMFLPILLIGLGWGFMYRYFLNAGSHKLFGYGIAVAVLVSANQLEITTTKLLGGMLVGFVVMALVQRLLVPSMHKALFTEVKYS